MCKAAVLSKIKPTWKTPNFNKMSFFTGNKINVCEFKKQFIYIFIYHSKIKIKRGKNKGKGNMFKAKLWTFKALKVAEVKFGGKYR